MASGFWRGIEKGKREAIVQDVTTAIANANHPGVVLFAAVIEKNERLYGEEAVKHVTEEVCRRFDLLLTRRYQEHDDPQRGLIVFAESSYEKRARIWVRGFRELGTRWGAINNLRDTPSSLRLARRDSCRWRTRSRMEHSCSTNVGTPRSCGRSSGASTSATAYCTGSCM